MDQVWGGSGMEWISYGIRYGYGMDEVWDGHTGSVDRVLGGVNSIYYHLISGVQI